MDLRTNTVLGWGLFAGIVALGAGTVSSMVYEREHVENPGYVIDAPEGDEAADAGPSFTALLAAADVAAGEQVFKKCTACHSINAGGANAIGPNIHGIVGDAKVSQPGFSYSSALQAIGGSWGFEDLDAWLKSPQRYAPGTTMSFAGLSSAEDRANLVAYMNAQGSNLPLPKAPAETPSEGEAAEDQAAETADPGGVTAGATTEDTSEGVVVDQAATGND